jgi:hypothetical protein
MGNKLTPKVILEGTRLTFKTEIAFELNSEADLRKRVRLPLVGGTTASAELPDRLLYPLPGKLRGSA